MGIVLTRFAAIISLVVLVGCADKRECCGQEDAMEVRGAGLTIPDFAAYSASPMSLHSMTTKEASFGFKRYRNYPLGDWLASESGYPVSLAVGDVTGDGRADVIVANTSNMPFHPLPIDQKLLVYQQDGLGALASPRMLAFTDGLYERANNFSEASVALADMNSDGVDDVIVGYGKGMAVLLGGSHDFVKRAYPMASKYLNQTPGWDNYFAKFVLPLDIDRDGNLDILLVNGGRSATAYYGDGRGNITAVEPILEELSAVTDAKIGDFDGDGFQDVVILSGDRSNRTFWIYPNTGGRRFGSPVRYTFSVDITYSSIAIGDWNGDGRSDIAVGIMTNMPGSSGGAWPGLWIFDQTIGGQLESPRFQPTLDVPKTLVSTDIDGDRRSDLLVEHWGWETIGVLVQSQGVLQQERLFGTPRNSSSSGFVRSIAAGDVDSDGCSDMLMTDINFGLVVLIAENCSRHVPVMAGPSQPRIMDVAAGKASLTLVVPRVDSAEIESVRSRIPTHHAQERSRPKAVHR